MKYVGILRKYNDTMVENLWNTDRVTTLQPGRTEIVGQVDRYSSISLRISPQHNGEMMGNWSESETLAGLILDIVMDSKNSYVLTTELVSPSPHGKKKTLFSKISASSH